MVFKYIYVFIVWLFCFFCKKKNMPAAIQASLKRDSYYNKQQEES